MFLKSYALPPWEFVRGETKEQRITLRHTDGSLYELGAVNVSMDIGDFVNRDMEPVYTGRQEIVNDDNGTSCILKLTLDSSVTEKLSGKYLYVVTITDMANNTVKLRGPMIVYDNAKNIS